MVQVATYFPAPSCRARNLTFCFNLSPRCVLLLLLPQRMPLTRRFAHSSVTSTANVPSISPIPCSFLSSTRPDTSSYLSRSVSIILHSLTTQDASNPRGFALPNGGGLGVGVCGPGGLGKGVREAISRVQREKAFKV